MNILHTVESYSPSVGGAQEVVKQISERLVQRGHSVTVATSSHPDRHININGVHIEEFDIRGNSVHGIRGEAERYQSFLRRGAFDIMMNYAAQQWASDLVYLVLDELPYKKIFIPCGFSGLYWPDYIEYFHQLPDVLRRYDHLVFHADDYRDTNFARQHNIENLSIIPNGASQAEFETVDGTFRQRYGIVEFDADYNVLSIEEKPQHPRSSYAVPGIYFYDNQVVKLAESLQPSPRGEIEITDLNRLYLEKGQLKAKLFGRGIAWLDAGTHESLLQAASFIQTIQERQGLMISCPEEIAYRKGYITKERLMELGKALAGNSYGDYLLDVARQAS